MMNRIGCERGWPPIGRDHFERETGPDGALFVGAPETVATKVVATVKGLALSRFDLRSNAIRRDDATVVVLGRRQAWWYAEFAWRGQHRQSGFCNDSRRRAERRAQTRAALAWQRVRT